MKNPKKVLIADADNTLYSWVDYIVPCLEAMVNTLSRLTGLPEDAIVESLKEVFEKHQTNEYAFVLQEAEIFAGLRARGREWFQEEIVRPTRYVFNRYRKMHLRLYPGVRSAFHRLVSRGVRIYVLSDAPAFSAEQRLKHLDLASCVTALYALKSYPVPPSPLLDPRVVNRIRAGYYRSRIGKVVEMPLEFEKPNPAGLQLLLEREGISKGMKLLAVRTAIRKRGRLPEFRSYEKLKEFTGKEDMVILYRVRGEGEGLYRPGEATGTRIPSGKKR